TQPSEHTYTPPPAKYTQPSKHTYTPPPAKYTQPSEDIYTPPPAKYTKPSEDIYTPPAKYTKPSPAKYTKPSEDIYTPPAKYTQRSEHTRTPPPAKYTQPSEYKSMEKRHSSRSYDKGCEDKLTTVITDKTITEIIKDTFENGLLPRDPNGIYLVLTSPDINKKSDRCHSRTSACGFHNYFTFEGQKYLYSWAGDWEGTGCSIRCAPLANKQKSPNDDVGTDALINLVSNLLAGTVTDPYVSGWNGQYGEIAALCSWNFGTVWEHCGATYNMYVGEKRMLIQNLWKVTELGGSGYCASV
ncbi:hypothetical protein BC936DRAFT_141044, partial [Jimgerdemannia flammicorona]